MNRIVLCFMRANQGNDNSMRHQIQLSTDKNSLVQLKSFYISPAVGSCYKTESKVGPFRVHEFFVLFIPLVSFLPNYCHSFWILSFLPNFCHSFSILSFILWLSLSFSKSTDIHASAEGRENWLLEVAIFASINKIAKNYVVNFFFKLLYAGPNVFVLYCTNRKSSPHDLCKMTLVQLDMYERMKLDKLAWWMEDGNSTDP